TGTGIVLGVAILFGVLVANATTQKGVDNLVQSITGRSDVIAGPVGVFGGTVPMGTVARLKKLPDVTDVIGQYEFGAALPDHPSKLEKGEPSRLGVGGIVPDEAKKIRDFPFDAGRFPTSGADEIVLSRKAIDDL